jgi:hypothetical protein
MLEMLEVRSETSFLFFSLTLSREVMWVSNIGCGCGPLGRERGRWVHTEKELLVNGTKMISEKRGIQWDRFQIRM